MSRGSLPASDSDGGSGRGIGARCCYGSIADGGAGRDRGRQFNDGEIVVGSVVVVVGVELNRGDTSSDAARAAVLQLTFNISSCLIECLNVREIQRGC